MKSLKEIRNAMASYALIAAVIIGQIGSDHLPAIHILILSIALCVHKKTFP